MKKIIFFILFAGLNINVFAQINNAMLKYWYYRDRLKYFVIPGEKRGESEIIGIRNDMASPYNNTGETNSTIGQHGVHFGFYLGMLATEYKLLMNNGQNEDALNTINELDLALLQFENYMDKCEGWWSMTSTEDGFFVRENMPCYFMDTTIIDGFTVNGERHLDLLNKKLNKHDTWDDATKTFHGLPPGHPGYTDLIYSRVCNTTDDTKEPMSQDEAIGVLMGLALVKRLCPQAEVSKSQEIACNIISYIQNKWLLHGPIPWQIYLPDGSPDPAGSLTIFSSYAFVKVAKFFKTDCIDENNDPGLDQVAELAWEVQQFIRWEKIYNNSMSAILAALGNSWHIGITIKIGCCWGWCPSWLCLKIPFYIPSTAGGINHVTSNYNNETFYLLLWEVLHNKSTDRLSMDKVAAQISSAPCYGPYNYSNGNHPANDAYGGWSSVYRWRDYISEQQGEVNEPGNYNGLAYMLFHNLLGLVTYGGTPYLNYIDRVLTGTVSQPEKFIGFNSITSTQTIEPTLPWVIYKAGNYIELKPGFHAEYGSNFHAYIGDISGCDDPTPANTIDTMCCFNHYNPKDTIIVPYYDSLVTIPQTPYNLTPENVEVIDTLPCGIDTLHFNGIADDTTITIYDSIAMHDTTISACTFSYQWDFGNGQTSNNKKVDVIYSPGTYHCQLIVTCDSTGVTDTLRFGFVVPVCPDTTIRGFLTENSFCGGAPVESDTLVLMTGGVVLPDSICRPALTNMYGEFHFDSLQIASLDDTLLYTIATKSGFKIQDVQFKTISEWIDESPLILVLATDSLCLTDSSNLKVNSTNASNNQNQQNPNIFIHIIPNPNNGNMQVVYEIPETETGIFEIYNLVGKKLLSYPLYGGKNTFSISATELDNGIYFYRATAGNKQIAADKIVIIP